VLSFEEGPPSPEPLLDGDLVLIAAVVGSLVLLGLLCVAYGILRSRRVPEQAGPDPCASQAQGAARPVGGTALPLEQRLAELDDLHRRGVLSTDEHTTARQQVLSGA
jgi:hypothetical protein